MRIIGLTGGMGSGKTTVAAMFSDLGGTVFNADLLAREILQKGSQTYHTVIAYFSNTILLDNGNIDRKSLASIVFNDPDALIFLNEITHKAIRKLFKEKLTLLEKKNSNALVLYDAPLLFETGFYQLLQKNILVFVDLAIQIERLRKYRGFTKKESLERIRNQMSLEQKKQLADCLIDNNADLDHTRNQVWKIFSSLRTLPEKKLCEFCF